ncbi:hypothetical protein EDC04DRAFT_2951511 [Pisolithus marmoratus]|nr:hypothetical protein EDC04DRAFT_2951511 [Pisolithus marmoratus]
MPDDSNPPPVYAERANPIIETTIPAQPRLTDPVQPPPAPAGYNTSVNSAYARSHRTQSKVHLVTPSQLKGHLALLHAFHELKKKVQDSVGAKFPDCHPRTLDGERRWAWFVALAVERMGLTALLDSNGGAPRSKIQMRSGWDCLLSMSSCWYAEDTFRIPALETLAKYNRILTVCLDCPILLTTTIPHAARARTWKRRTGTQYDPFKAMSVLTQKPVVCPKCNRTFDVAFVDCFGRGYAQSSFKTSCSCGLRITKDDLGMAKFLRNLVTQDPGKYFAGTLHTPQDARDTVRAEKIRQMILRSAPLAKNLSNGARPTIQDLVAMGAVNLRRGILESVRAKKIVKRVFSAYTDDRMFSIDLVGAVLRQSSFTQKMYDLGWTAPRFFDSEEDAVVLKHCIARYKGFLGLMTNSPGSFFVPTLDIDLAWHTHQLIAQRYDEECMELVGRDDKVEEDKLATSFDVTCRAWQNQYGLPYIFCGCALPGETIGQRLGHAFRCLQVNDCEGSGAGNHSSLVPGAGTGAAATHPSDHNAVFLMHKMNAGMLARKRRQAKIEARRTRELKRIERETEKEDSAGVEGKTKLKRNGREKKRHEPPVATPAMLMAQQRVKERRAFWESAHSPAFSTPVPPSVYAPGGCVGAASSAVNGVICGGWGAGCAAGLGGCSGSACGGCSGGGCGGGCGGGGCGGGGCGGGGCGGGGG